MRKGSTVLLVVMCLFCLLGCSEEKQGESGRSKIKTEFRFMPEDFRQETAGMMMTEKGYYYCSVAERAFHYYDFATEKDIYLCNKPECKHDGNVFCAASNNKYRIDRVCMYNGKILATAVEETDTEYLFKLLIIAPDGSELSEYMTYMTIEKTGFSSIAYSDDILFVHRNVAVVPMKVTGQEALGDVNYYGTAFLNLDTKEVFYLDEKPLDKENKALSGFNGYGDYIFYCMMTTPKKIELCRYDMTDGTKEKCKLLSSFRGGYVLLDENTVVYLRSGGKTFFVYDHVTESNEEKEIEFTFTEHLHSYDGTMYLSERPSTARGLRTDGTYFYIADESYVREDHAADGSKETVYVLNSYLHVYTKDYKSVAEKNVGDYFSVSRIVVGKALNSLCLNMQLYYFGDDIYGRWKENETSDEFCIVRCKRADLLSGNPNFELWFKEAK